SSGRCPRLCRLSLGSEGLAFLCGAFPAAGAADALALRWVGVEVVPGVGVPLRAGGLPGVLRCWADPPQVVQPRRHRFEVLVVDAGAVAAEVVELHSGGDGADVELVGESVCVSLAGRPVGCDAEIELAVADAVEPAGPEEAAVLAGGEPLEEPFDGRPAHTAARTGAAGAEFGAVDDSLVAAEAFAAPLGATVFAGRLLDNGEVAAGAAGHVD